MPSSSCVNSLQIFVQSAVIALPGASALLGVSGARGLLKWRQDCVVRGLVLRSIVSQRIPFVWRAALQTLAYLQGHLSVIGILPRIVKDMSHLQGHKGF